MKKVLLLGDSIRIGYQDYVKSHIDADVYFPEENGRFAKYTLWGVHVWIRELGIPDIVHWNNGLWDVHHEAPRVEALTPLDEYIQTLGRIINELKRMGSAIIFATTTPVAPDAADRSNAEIDRYNAAAAELMAFHGIEVNDLNALVRQDMKNNICEDKLHLSAQGYELCGRQVCDMIKKYL